MCRLLLPDESHTSLAWACRQGGKYQVSMSCFCVSSGGQLRLHEDCDVGVDVGHRVQRQEEACFPGRHYIVHCEGDVRCAGIVVRVPVAAALLSELLEVFDGFRRRVEFLELEAEDIRHAAIIGCHPAVEGELRVIGCCWIHGVVMQGCESDLAW